jgi:hypothetical protein
VSRVAKFVPLYGEVDSIPANSQVPIIEYKVPTGYVAELFAIGVIPDYDPATGASYLDGVSVAHATDVGAGVGSVFPHSNISANHNGKNAAPYGDRASKQPILVIDRPLTPNNLTYKFASGRVIQIVGKAGSTATGKVRARAFIYLLDASEVVSRFGAGLNEFASLPGGHNQERPVLPYFEYYDNKATAGTGSWEKLAQIKVEDYEEIQLTQIGVAPHDNAYQLRLYDDRENKYFPDRDPYYFRITPEENMLPFGDDDDYQPRLPLPEDITTHVWTHTSLDLEIKDKNAVIPDAGVRVQLVGIYRAKR